MSWKYLFVQINVVVFSSFIQPVLLYIFYVCCFVTVWNYDYVRWKHKIIRCVEKEAFINAGETKAHRMWSDRTGNEKKIITWMKIERGGGERKGERGESGESRREEQESRKQRQTKKRKKNWRKICDRWKDKKKKRNWNRLFLQSIKKKQNKTRASKQ